MKLHKFINMNKVIISSFLAIGILLGCKKKEKEPLEYFSFTANGVDYYYPQDETPGGLFGGPSNTLGAGSAGYGLGFQIYAFSLEDPASPGEFRFTFFPGDQIPQQDTIILNGVNNGTVVQKFLNQEAYYKLLPPQKGKIIFTERTEEKLSGTFEFEATRTTTPVSGSTDSILHVTNGKFSIKPTLQND